MPPPGSDSRIERDTEVLTAPPAVPRPDHLRVVVCDDQHIFRAGLRRILGSMPHIDVVGEADSAAEAVGLSAGLAPNVALVGDDLPGGVLPLIQTLSGAGIRVIVLGVDEPPEDDLIAVRQAGAEVYLSRGVSPSYLLDIVSTPVRS